MYNPPAFREDDPVILAAIMRQARLCTLVSNGPEDVPLITHLPLQFSDGVVIGHMARANPHWHGLRRGVAIFPGVEAYVSPSFYPSKAETHQVVPTWNYEAVHAHGPIEVVEDAARLHEIVSGLTRAHEERRAEPWAVTDAPERYIAGQLKGIVGIVLRVERLIGKRKLSQNRNAADAGGAAAGLAASPDARDQAVAAAMVLARR